LFFRQNNPILDGFSWVIRKWATAHFSVVEDSLATGKNNLVDLLEPVINDLGYELLTVEYSATGNQSLLRVYIDSPAGINVDDCARTSREVSAILDVNDPVSGKYLLEVSSPGADRPLVKAEHFERVIGERIKVKMKFPVMGRQRFTGKLQQLDGSTLVLDVDNEAYDLPLEDVEKANLVAEF